jgi:hypothetical protein
MTVRAMCLFRVTLDPHPLFFTVSYSGTPAFFNVIGEMRQPKDYNKALYACQTVVTATYLTIGIVVYFYCGQYLANPALGSAGMLITRIRYLTQCDSPLHLVQLLRAHRNDN